jgi:manganese transport protein
MFTSDRKRMGEFANSWPLKIAGYAVCTLIAALNIYLLFETIGARWMSAVIAVSVLFTIWVMFFYKEKPKAKSV